MKPSLALLLLSGLPILIASIAGAADVVSEEDQYRNVVKGRAEKIVSALSIPDDAARMRVQTAISNQYVNLHAVHAKRDATIKAAANGADTANAEEPGRRAKENASTETARLHDAFLKQLAADLSPGQVDQVKDGMTYGVVPLTYGVYLKMYPDLRESEKKQIMDWLVEARETAMDMGSSEEKHAVFNKYKGKINNFLSKAGYDSKKGRENLKAPK